MRTQVARRNLLLAGIGLALMSLVSPARADFTAWQTTTINNPFQPSSGIYTNWTNSQAVFVYNPVTNTTIPYTVPTPTYAQFDPNAHFVNGKPGQLVGVELVMEYKFENTISLRFDTLSTLRVDVTGKMQLTMPTGSLVTANFPGPNDPNPVGNPTNNAGQYLNSSGNITLSPANLLSKSVELPKSTITGFVASPAGTGYTDGATLAKFTGTSTVTLPILAQANYNFFSNTGNGFGGSSTLATAIVSIRYLFVPEPSSMVLMGFGVVGLIWAGRARRSAPAVALDQAA